MQEDITIKIGADTAQARKAVENLTKEANELGKKANEIRVNRKAFTPEQVKDLKKEIEETALKCRALYFAEGNESARELSERLKEMHKAINSINKEAGDTNKTFLNIDLIASNLVSNLITKGAGAILSMAKAGVELNRQLEYADKKIQSISDKSSIEIESNISKISLDTGTDSIALRQGLYEVISAIGDVPEAYKVLNVANKLAITGFTDIANAVDGLTTVLNGYKLGLSQTDRVANIFVKTQKLGKITVDELSRNLSRSVPLAKQLGIGIEDIATAMATLTSVGVRAPEAETKLAGFFRNLFDESTELYKAFKKQTGVSARDYIKNGGEFIGIFEEIAKFDKSFGSMSMDGEAKTLIAIMTELTDKYRAFRKEISDTDNAIDKSMANMMDSQQASLARANEYWKKFAISLSKISSEVIAYIGDIVSHYDRVGEKEKNQRNELSERLNKTAFFLEQLQKGTKLTDKEQESLNENMIYFTAFAPDVSSAYTNITDTAEKYRKTLEEIVKTQIAVKETAKQAELSALQNNVDSAERNIKDIQDKIVNMFGFRYINNMGIDESSKYANLTYEDVKGKALPSNASLRQREEYNKLLMQLSFAEKNKALAKNNLDTFNAKQNGTYKEPELPKIEAEANNVATTNEVISEIKNNEDLKSQIESQYRNEQLRIEIEYNKERLAITKEFNEQMALLKGKGTQEEIKAIEEAYKSKMEQANFTKDYKSLDNKLRNTFYDNDNERKLNSDYLNSQKAFLLSDNQMRLEGLERDKLEKERIKSEEELKKSLDGMSSNLRNLSSLFQTIGENSNSTAVKNIANGLNVGSTVFDYLQKSESGKNLIGNILGTANIPKFENITMGSGIGSAISGALGGGTEGNIGSTVGSLAGTVIGGPVGSVVGGALGGAIGSVFGSKSKKKKKREERKRKKAQERLQKGLISGRYRWEDVIDEFNEELERSDLSYKIGMLDKISTNTNYDNILGTLESAKRGKDGVSMTALKELMPQYSESEIMDWFKAVTGGAVLNGDTLSTGEGKYGAIDLSALAQQITNTNRELEKSLKEVIKNIIDFSADSLASIVKDGFFDGIDDIGDGIEQMLANSIKNAFINTEVAKGLFNGLSDKVQDYITDMFKNDKNLGINIGIDNFENLTFEQYIESIKKYMELSDEKMEQIFNELGLNIDNLTNGIDKLNENMSKNVVQGIATNLWKQNLGIKEPVKVNSNITIDMPVTLSGKEMDRYIVKVVNDSINKSRRSGNGIGRG